MTFNYPCYCCMYINRMHQINELILFFCLRQLQIIQNSFQLCSRTLTVRKALFQHRTSIFSRGHRPFQLINGSSMNYQNYLHLFDNRKPLMPMCKYKILKKVHLKLLMTTSERKQMNELAKNKGTFLYEEEILSTPRVMLQDENL